VYHGHHDPREWFNFEFFAKIMRGLDLHADDFIALNQPTIIPRLLIPQTSLMEQQYAYPKFREMCLNISNALGIVPQAKIPGSFYYSKSKLKSGVGNLINEHEIDEIMTQHGITVIYPETMTFEKQIDLLSSATTLIGTAGSFLHNIAFVENPPNMVILNPTNEINSNFALLDKLSDADVCYLFSTDIRMAASVNNDFLTSRELPNAREVALAMIEIAQAGQLSTIKPIIKPGSR